MSRLEELRHKLYEALDEKSGEDVLAISRELDKEILKFLDKWNEPIYSLKEERDREDAG